MSVTAAAVVSEARHWIGTPWRHQAALCGVGCDCIGLVAGVAERLGLPEAKAWREDARFRGYGPIPDPTKLKQACALYLDEVALPGEPGDVLLFTFMQDPMHFGIVSEDDPRYVIHAYQPRDAVVENALTGKWQRRVIGAYRYRGKV